MNRIYCGPPPLAQEIWTRWNSDPFLLAALLVLALLTFRDRSGRIGVAMLVVAFVSPLCALSSALFSARVAHHVLLVAIAAPLLAQVLPARKVGALALPFAILTATLWTWHLPVVYDLALSNVAAYWLMQVTLLGSATWFWRAVFAAGRTPVEAILFVVASFAQMGMLGAVLSFAPHPLYAAHAIAPLEWGLTPLADQQLGGLLMWVPAGLPYAVVAGVLARRGWVRSREQAA